MLVLSRQLDERIILSDKNFRPIANIQVIEVRGDNVRIGIEVDDETINIDREEIYRQKIKGGK